MWVCFRVTWREGALRQSPDGIGEDACSTGLDTAFAWHCVRRR